ncbi:MAG: hypothetical protein ABI599_11690 [Flavobacteriales bacterium]
MTFGGTGKWLSNTLYAAEEWLTTNRSEGPITRMVLIDASKKQFARFKIVAGFINPQSLVGDTMTYLKDMRTGGGAESEVTLSAIRNWEKYA